MRISVVIPCLNAAETLGQQLDAVSQQTVQPWEVIVADNGSTDQTREIAAQYADRLPRFQIVDASDRRGASHARNVGAAVAEGDYLAFCDADDVVAEDWMAALQNAFTKHKFLACRFDYKRLNRFSLNTNQDTQLQDFRIPFMPFAGGGGLAVSRTLHNAVSGFDESLLFLEDVDYCIRVQLLGVPLVFVPEALIHIRHTVKEHQSFIAARKAAFQYAYNWGSGHAKVYKRYRHKGMYIHGIAPRLALTGLWALRVVFSGLSDRSLDRLGWHVGVLQELMSWDFAKLQLPMDILLWLKPARKLT